jgi:hypothetical protein
MELCTSRLRLREFRVLALPVVDNSTWVGKRRCEEMKRNHRQSSGSAQRARMSRRNESRLKECGGLPNTSDN